MNESQALFSIVTICWNAASCLAPTLRSVDGQTFTDYEHLIIDGASTDGTLSLLESTPSAMRRIVSERDKGIYDAMNKGIRHARGRYLIFLNAGDALHAPDSLQKIADAIALNGEPDVVYGQTDIVDADGKRIGPRHLTAPDVLSWKDFSRGMLVCHQAFVAKAELAPEYDLQYRFSADYDWCIRVLQKSSKIVGLGNTVLIDYLAEGATTRNRFKSLRERFGIMCRYYGTVPTAMRHAGFVFRALGRGSL